MKASATNHDQSCATLLLLDRLTRRILSGFGCTFYIHSLGYTLCYFTNDLKLASKKNEVD